MEYNFADVIREKEKIHSKYIEGCCVGCPLSLTKNGHNMFCDELMEIYPDNFAKIVMDWAKAHKPKTNGEVARELLEEKFGIEIPEPFRGCMNLGCTGTDSCDDCPKYGFWNREYVGE